MRKGWSKEVVLIVLLVAWLIYLHIRGMFDGYADGAQAYENIERGKGWQYWGDVSNQWQAFIAAFFGATTAALTFMLYRVTNLQRILTQQQKELLEKDLGISEQALAEARENSKAALIAANAARDSAEALIRSERGTLIYEGAGRDNMMLGFLFLVAGKQPLTMIAMCHQFQFANAEADVVAPEDMSEWDLLGVNVGPGDHWGAWRGEAERLTEAPSIPIPIPVWNRMRDGHEDLVVTLRMIYRTTFGRYTQSHTFMFTEGRGAVTLWRPDLTHEWRDVEWMANFAKAREENRNQGEIGSRPEPEP